MHCGYKMGRVFSKRKMQMIGEKELFHLESVRSIGFIFDASENLEPFYTIKELIDLFKEKKYMLRKTHILAYSENKNLNKQFNIEQFNKSDFNFWGAPKSFSIKEFININFGILIDYSNGENQYIRNVLSLSNAEFKLGSRWGENLEENLNFIINVKHSGMDSFNHSVINYLSKTNEQIR